MLNSSCLSHWASFSQYLGLGLMIGGMLALGAFTAPVLFKMFPRPEAGEAMTIIFRRYDAVLAVALGVIVLGQAISWFVDGCPWQLGTAGWIRFGLFTALTVTMAYGIWFVSPKMTTLLNTENFRNDAALQQEFRALHTQSEKVYKLGMLLAVLMMASLSFAGGCPVMVDTTAPEVALPPVSPQA